MHVITKAVLSSDCSNNPIIHWPTIHVLKRSVKPSWRHADGENSVDGKETGYGRDCGSIRRHRRRYHGCTLITSPNHSIKVHGFAYENLRTFEFEFPFPKPERKMKSKSITELHKSRPSSSIMRPWAYQVLHAH